MKVSLATQTVNDSVATALEILCTSERLKQDRFQGAEATIKFLRIFDKLFDVGNSKNLNAVGFKAPLTRKTFGNYLKLFDEASNLMVKLTGCHGPRARSASAPGGRQPLWHLVGSGAGHSPAHPSPVAVSLLRKRPGEAGVEAVSEP